MTFLTGPLAPALAAIRLIAGTLLLILGLAGRRVRRSHGPRPMAPDAAVIWADR